MRYMQEYVNHTDAIFLRGHVSEAVHAQVISGSNPFQDWQRQMLDLYAINNTVRISCDVSKNTFAKRAMEKPDPLLRMDQLTVIRERYYHYNRELDKQTPVWRTHTRYRDDLPGDSDRIINGIEFMLGVMKP